MTGYKRVFVEKLVRERAEARALLTEAETRMSVWWVVLQQVADERCAQEIAEISPDPVCGECNPCLARFVLQPTAPLEAA